MRAMKNTSAFWGEIWKLALQALLANKLRSVLTMLGVIIGSASIVLVVTIALSGQRYVVGQIEGIGANLVYARVVTGGEGEALAQADQINSNDLAAVKEALPNLVSDAAGVDGVSMTVTAGGQERPVNLVGVTNGFEKIRNLAILRGRYFDADDLQFRSKVCLITQTLARRVFPAEDPVGKDIQVGDLHFSVIGVFTEHVGAIGQTEISRESVLIPYALLHYFTGTNNFQTLYVSADRPEDVPLVTRQVREILRSQHRAGANYRVENLTGILETAKNIALGLTVVLILVALIALVISGIGIMNIMLVTVTERTREIGIRKAIGASHDAIRFQFLMEALAISGTGALAGVLIAIAIPALMNFLIGFFPDAEGIVVPVSWVSVLLAFVVSSSTGLVFGFLPANRAARLQPTESLHHE
ncbi:MAG TPA: ABC transporter permease [Candidatus Acidoferrales bacterium]|nr:ABC transporter permease [Candidatus Acidoferrales bacterium]